MKTETQDWVDSAEADWTAVQQLNAAGQDKVLKAICFHAQQCAEMYLKARLTEAVLYFPKTHNLSELLDRTLPVEPGWEGLRAAAEALSLYAVITRYPGYRLSREEAEEAVHLCAALRNAVRAVLGLSE